MEVHHRKWTISMDLMDFHVFPWISYAFPMDCLWVFYGFLCIFNGFHGFSIDFLWISMDFPRISWISMDFYGFHGFPWIFHGFIDFYGFPWNSMGGLWIFYGFHGLSMHFLWISRQFPACFQVAAVHHSAVAMASRPRRGFAAQPAW